MDDILRKIEGLLKKANGTDNEHESEAFYAKAQELMLKYAVDEAEMRAMMGKSTQSAKPIMTQFEYSSSDSNAKGKIQLLNLIARANRVRVVDLNYGRGQAQRMGISTTVAAQWCALVGYDADIEFVKMMYASLMIQSARMGSKAFKMSGRASGKSRFMTQYLFGFAEAIHQRFAAMGRANPLPTEQSALIVRVNEEVNDALRDFFPRLKTVGFATKDHAAVNAGRVGGSQADLGISGIRGGKGRALRLGSGQ